MGRLSILGKRALRGSGRRLASALGTAKGLTEDFRELLATPIDPPTPSTAPAGPPPTPEVPKLGDPEKPAQVFGRESCPWTGRARSLFEREGRPYEFVNLDEPENASFTSWLVVETKQHTEPYVFLRGRFIGGYNALDEIARLGQLQYQMLSAEEKARQTSRVVIEVASRDDQNRRPPGES